jgi:glutaminase
MHVMTRVARTLFAIGLVTGTVHVATAFSQEPAGNLPFTNIYKRPAVSPYTMLGNPQNPMGINNQTGAITDNTLIYQQLIQPRLEQERQQMTMLRQNRQLGNLQNQVQSIQRDTSMRQIDRSIRPTGHSSTYMNTSHYYGNNGGGRR